MEKKIFYSEDKVWKGFEAPEKEYYLKRFGSFSTAYAEAYAEAKRNALQIINPEIIQESEQFPYDVYKIINGISDPQDYVWPGTWEVKTERVSNVEKGKEEDSSYGIILSLPEPVKLTPEQAAKVEEGMNLWRGKPESKTKTEEYKTHLEWLYLRMILVHGENSNYDYMIKFKEIIDQL
jgi:hypothetical protein